MIERKEFYGPWISLNYSTESRFRSVWTRLPALRWSRRRPPRKTCPAAFKSCSAWRLPLQRSAGRASSFVSQRPHATHSPVYHRMLRLLARWASWPRLPFAASLTSEMPGLFLLLPCSGAGWSGPRGGRIKGLRVKQYVTLVTTSVDT